MKIAILKERRPHETRVAATPETVKKLKALGAEEIVIEAGAGLAAAYTDEAYAEAGANIVPDAASAFCNRPIKRKENTGEQNQRHDGFQQSIAILATAHASIAPRRNCHCARDLG